MRCDVRAEFSIKSTVTATPVSPRHVKKGRRLVERSTPLREERASQLPDMAYGRPEIYSCFHALRTSSLGEAGAVIAKDLPFTHFDEQRRKACQRAIKWRGFRCLRIGAIEIPLGGPLNATGVEESVTPRVRP